MSAPLAPSAASADQATIAWLVERAPVSKEAQQATAGATDVDALLTLLVDAGHSADALRVVAAALPPRSTPTARPTFRREISPSDGT